MRNQWYPKNIAEYVTVPQLRTLRTSNITMERDFSYGVKKEPIRRTAQELAARGPSMSKADIEGASAFQKPAVVEKLSPERSAELIEAFVLPRLEFYRQPIIEEKTEEKEEPATPPPQPKKAPNLGTGAAADLLAARMQQPEVPKVEKKKVPQAIYGSVSPLDVLQAVRAAMAENDEAKRVVLSEQDLHFVNLPDSEGDAAKVVKHVGDFEIEIKIKGADTVVRRTVRVLPQELETLSQQPGDQPVSRETYDELHHGGLRSLQPRLSLNTFNV
jgi:hypothetical protein